MNDFLFHPPQACKVYGYTFNLASIHSLKENAFIATMAANVNVSWDKEVWIGAHSTQNGGDSFAWSDYSEFNVDNWAQYQPDEVVGVLSTLWCFRRQAV